MHVVGSQYSYSYFEPCPGRKGTPGCAIWVGFPGRAVDWYLPHEVIICLAREDDGGLVLEGGRIGGLMDGWMGWWIGGLVGLWGVEGGS